MTTCEGNLAMVVTKKYHWQNEYARQNNSDCRIGDSNSNSGDCYDTSEKKMTIKQLIELSGLSMAKFARFYGIPYRTVQNWEDGKRKPPEYVLTLLERVVKEDFEATTKKEEQE